MHLSGRNNPCGEKEQDRDESEQKKSSLRHKRASWGCIRVEEIIPAAQKSKPEMNKNRYEKAASRGTRLFREKRIENMYSEAVPRKNRLTTVLESA